MLDQAFEILKENQKLGRVFEKLGGVFKKLGSVFVLEHDLCCPNQPYQRWVDREIPSLLDTVSEWDSMERVVTQTHDQAFQTLDQVFQTLSQAFQILLRPFDSLLQLQMLGRVFENLGRVF